MFGTEQGPGDRATKMVMGPRAHRLQEAESARLVQSSKDEDKGDYSKSLQLFVWGIQSQESNFSLHWYITCQEATTESCSLGRPLLGIREKLITKKTLQLWIGHPEGQ